MNRPIRIGNQTAVSSADPLEPFRFALEHGFDAFEWFADKKTNADHFTQGWEEADFDPALRAHIRETGRSRDIRFSMHAPWQANPLHPEGIAHLLQSIDFARDIGADLVNLHLYMDAGAQAYAEAIQPVLKRAAAAQVRISIENTPHTSPDDFNQTFACLRPAVRQGLIGMCFDLGHANLCSATHNDYLRYLDTLSAEVPLIHLHVHENYGDADRHLPLFTGPSRDNDVGIRCFLERLARRQYQGLMILEQWPRPPQLLVDARTRLRDLLGGI
ncbi:MAG: sugar phosphate isomerase/epimerase [Gemmataceae bacterium]|nr:sugar phosphate isomerase/epimerase [Gemmataceae bacterium]